MRKSLLLFPILAALAVTALAQNAGSIPYKIEFDRHHDVTAHERDKDGREGLFITVKFGITLDGNKVDRVGDEYRLVIEEDGHHVKDLAVPKPGEPEDLSVMLAIDTSGSMKEHGRMPQARAAAETFLGKLSPKSDCGLILFDHEIRQQMPPILPREPLLQQIRTTEPRGGTAYLDAAAAGVKALKDMPPGRSRAVVLMTDGIDLNSSTTIDQVEATAAKEGVRIYTIGIGEPGKLDRVSTALVLDHSGSMKPPADDKDTTPKFKAMHEAASRFVSSMSSVGRVTLIPFSSGVEDPTPFTSEKFFLRSRINQLDPIGETALFDAVYAGIATLEADGTRGKRAVVAMTDGIDNSSRRRVEEIVERAKEANIPLYLLGFGREGELDRDTMERMARETGGRYYHARNKETLLEIFENLSIALHDDGIDEGALRRLADRTGGQYFPAKNVADLKFILERVSKSIQRERYEVTFPSLSQVRDGRQRNVALKLVRRGAGSSRDEVVGREEGSYQTGGLVVAEMSPFVYLGLLAVLAALAGLPAFLSRRQTPAE